MDRRVASRGRLASLIYDSLSCDFCHALMCTAAIIAQNLGNRGKTLAGQVLGQFTQNLSTDLPDQNGDK